MSNSRYLVSVRLMTFNHEAYIREAMNGILMQQTDFNVEVIVGDDFSTDNTLSIIKEYRSTDRIHITVLERSLGDDYWIKRREKGRLYNFFNILDHCTGSYIALLDGDDYWTDPLKLQKQVSFLEANPNYSICFHEANMVFPDKEILHTKLDQPKTFTLTDVLQKNFISTASCLFRNIGVTDRLPQRFLESPVGDWPLHIANAEIGDIFYMPDLMSVYRRNVGLWSRKPKRRMIADTIQTLRSLDLVFDYKYHSYFKKSIEELKKQKRQVFKKEMLERIKWPVKYIKNKTSNFFGAHLLFTI